MGRDVYPGFMQLTGFLSMNFDRHADAHRALFWHLVEGDGDSADKHIVFYDEYMSVMDLTAEYYLQTVDKVFVNHEFPLGKFTHRGEHVDPGAITKTGQIWHFDKIRRSISTAAIADGLVYVSDFSGYLHCLDAKTGQEYWNHDLLAAVWASPFLIDGKVYLGDEDGDVVVMAHGKEKKQLAEMNMGSAVYGTVVPANGVLFINNRSQLFAIANK
jgi:outer membrane protein assembly factor BamB